MKFSTRCLPFGSLPYDNIDIATRMLVKVFEKFPYIPTFPNISADDNIETRTLDGMPGFSLKNGKYTLTLRTADFLEKFKELDTIFNKPTKENLEKFQFKSPFMKKYFLLIDRLKPPDTCINLLGPFSIAQIFSDIKGDKNLLDKNYRKLIIQIVVVRALWIINKIKELSPDTQILIMFEEPELKTLGKLKHDNSEIDSEFIINFYSRIFERIKAEGCFIGIQCMEKCDWQVPIKAGVDVISFDAYNNPNNLAIFSETIEEFIRKGGKINWAIIPTKTEVLVKNTNINNISERLFNTFNCLINAGVSKKFVYNSALVSLQGNTKDLPVILAEKTYMLASQLAKQIPVIK